MKSSLILFGIFISFFQFPGYLYVQTTIAILISFYAIPQFIKRPINIKISYPLFLLLWLLWSILTIFWVKDFVAWLMYNAIIFIAFVYAISILEYINVDGFIEKIFKLLLISNIIHNLIALGEYFTEIYIFNFNTTMVEQARAQRAPLSFFDNTNDLAFYLMFSFVFIYFLMKPRKLKWILLISNFFLILTSGSRLVLIGLVVGSIFYILFLSYNRLSAWFLRVVISIVVILTLFFLVNTSFDDIQNIDISAYIRTNLFMNSFDFLRKSKFIGVGAGNIPYYLENYSNLPVYGIYQVHSWWVDILVTFGIPFFVVYVVKYLKTLAKSIKLSLNFDSPLYKANTVLLISFIIASNSSSVIFPRIWMWILLGTIFIVTDAKVKESEVK